MTNWDAIGEVLKLIPWMIGGALGGFGLARFRARLKRRKEVPR